jgi:hypothetical protein
MRLPGVDCDQKEGEEGLESEICGVRSFKRLLSVMLSKVTLAKWISFVLLSIKGALTGFVLPPFHAFYRFVALVRFDHFVALVYRNSASARLVYFNRFVCLVRFVRFMCLVRLDRCRWRCQF